MKYSNLLKIKALMLLEILDLDFPKFRVLDFWDIECQCRFEAKL